jgi:CHAT domain-containing protein/tetratricopeptide (TPR) repeat protein
MRLFKGRNVFPSLLLIISSLGPSQESRNSAPHEEKLSVVSIIRQGKEFRFAGEFDKAVDLLQKALGISRANNKPADEAACLTQLGIAFWDLGQISEPSSRFQAALDIARRHRDILDEGAFWKFQEIVKLYSQGKDYRSKNLDRQSIECFDKAIALSRAIGISDFELKCLRQESVTYWQMDDFEKFFTCNKRALGIARTINHRKETGQCLINMGVYYEKTSDYSNALRCLEEALVDSEKMKDRIPEAECLSNIGGIYLDLEIYDNAESYFERAIAIDKTIGEHEDLAIDLNNMAIAILNKTQLENDVTGLSKALLIFRECLELLNEQENKKLIIQVINNIGYISYLKGEYRDASKVFQECLTRAMEIGYKEGIYTIYSNLGNASRKCEDYKGAQTYYMSAINGALDNNYYEILWEAYYGLGQCYEAKNDLLKALLYYKKSIDIIDKIRKRITLDIFKIDFARNKTVVYQRAIKILHSLYSSSPSEALFEEMFSTIERAKARAFLESLVDGKVNTDGVTVRNRKNRERAISHDISDVFKRLSEPGLSRPRREELMRDLELKEEEYLRFISGLKTEERSNTDMDLPATCSISEVQSQLLNDRTAILEYHIGEERSLLFFITRHRSKLYELPGRAVLEDSLRAYLKILAHPSPGPFAGLRAAERITRELAVPLGEEIQNGIDTLLIIPDGVLHYLPFETLRMNLDGRAVYLIEKFKISYCPSSASLLFLEQRQPIRRPSKNLLCIGAPSYKEEDGKEPGMRSSPADVWKEIYMSDGFNFALLPFARDEIRNISRIFPVEGKDIFMGRDANEALLKKLPMNEYRIIHFACHGFLDEKSPFRSALVLSFIEGQDEDGFLQVREINSLQLNADLVVLSACQTGYGSLEKSEGLLGLNRTFFHAGARAVLSSLWPINDRSTAVFMSDFYRLLAQGDDKSTALRKAKLKMLGSSRSHPFYWAGFVLHGNQDAIPLGGSANAKLN